MTGFRLERVYGTTGGDGRPAAGRGGGASPDDAGRAGDRVAFNSPVGVAEDRRGNVWVADAGNDRILVFDSALERVVATVGRGAGHGDAGADADLELPFRFAPHPSEPAMFATDLGNGRVVRFDYADGDGGLAVTVGATFGVDDGPVHPNGVAAHEYPDGLRLFVADEFFHEGTDLRSRILVFDADGTRRDEFRAVREDGGTVPLYWPQGLAVDDAGHLYVANTGSGVLYRDLGAHTHLATVLRCDRTGRAVPFEGLASPVLAELAMPRDVAVVGRDDDRAVLVPDAATGRVHAYGADGLERWAYPDDGFDDVCERAAPEEGLADAAGVRGRRSLRGPVSVAPYSGPHAGATGVLVTEALAHAVGAWTVDVADPALRGLVTVATTRDAPSQLAFPAASALVPRGAEGATAVFADAANGRLQRTETGPGGGLEPVALPANRFPFGLATWDAPDGPRLFVSEFSRTYAETDDAPQIHVYAVRPDGAGAWLDHVAAFGEWGLGAEEMRLPRGMAVDPVDDRRARLYVADAGNGRVDVWTYDRVAERATATDDLGVFGHAEGMFWNPADVAVGEAGVYVADANNNRLQRHDGDGWQVVGEPGYGDAGARFLLPVSVAAHDGYLFVTDLVNRAVKAFAERPGADGPAVAFCDAVGRLGATPADGDLWMPYALAAGDAGSGAVDLLVPDASLNVAYRYTWRPGT